MSLDYTWIDLRICWVLDRLAPHKLPRALDSLLLYQQPSSTTLYYSYPGIFALIKVRLRNETGKLHAPKGTCCPSSTSPFPEDCAHLKPELCHEPARRVWGKWWCRWRMRGWLSKVVEMRRPPVLLVQTQTIHGWKLQTLLWATDIAFLANIW